jgi:hypothetical protein
MQCDHGGKRPVAIGLVELRMQGQVGRGDVDLVRRRQRRGIRAAGGSDKRQE